MVTRKTTIASRSSGRNLLTADFWYACSRPMSLTKNHKLYFSTNFSKLHCRQSWEITMPVRSTVVSVIETVAAEQAKTLVPLKDDLLLAEAGLDSLCLALVVVKLEDRLGCDPFTESEEANFPVTLGEFVRLYEDAVR
jgi:hypothetical protein